LRWCSITSALIAAIPETTEIIMETVEVVEAVEEAPALEIAEAVEVSMEAVEVAVTAVPKIPTPVVRRSAYARARVHLALGSLCTVRRC
jgi:hypothetical protein